MLARTAVAIWQTDCTWEGEMKPQPTSSRQNRVLMALAAAWIVLSLAIGGAVSASETRAAGRDDLGLGGGAALTP